MERAYVHNAGKYEEEVIVASSLEEARKIAGDDNAEFLVEPLRAYNTPQGELGIVIATSERDLRTNPKANMEYWDEVDAVIRKHVKECIDDLKKWSVKDIQLNKDNNDEEDTLVYVSKLVGEVLIEKLEEYCQADFPLCNEE